MDKTKIKRIVAREGLILFALVLIGSIVFLCVSWSKDNPNFISLEAWWRGLVIGFFVIPFYAIYLPVRFVIWAIKTLKNKG